MDILKGKNILVTGGTGLIGSHLIELLMQKDSNIRTITHEKKIPGELLSLPGKIDFIQGDLTIMDDCKKAVKDVDFVFQLAASVGGVAYNISHPGSLFTQNVLMQTNMLEAARQNDIKGYLFTSSACVYPSFCEIPIKEDECKVGEFDKPPEPTNGAYGWAKRVGEMQSRYYKEQYDMKIAIVRPFNAYGPRDKFDPEKSHVIPALIRKAVEKQNPFKVWGNGEPSRDFVFASDIARGMILALEKYPVADPVNLTSGKDIKIKDLASLIVKLSGHKNTKIVFDKTKPLGQIVRKGSTEKAKRVLGFETSFALEDGLKIAIDWYRKYGIEVN